MPRCVLSARDATPITVDPARISGCQPEGAPRHLAFADPGELEAPER